MAEIWLTEREVEKRRQKLDYLKGERRLEIAEMLKIARGFGDLSENAEYDAALDAQAHNEFEIQELEAKLKNVVIIDESEISVNTVSLGSLVRLRLVDVGIEEEYQVVSETEAKLDVTPKRISRDSAIGGGVLGHKVGETVTVETPGGLMKVSILSIRR